MNRLAWLWLIGLSALSNLYEVSASPMSPAAQLRLQQQMQASSATTATHSTPTNSRFAQTAAQRDNNTARNNERRATERFNSLAFASSDNADKELNDSNISLNADKEFGTMVKQPLPVFGANLFGRQCSTLRQAHFFNASHRLSVGDQINVQIWGVFEFSKTMIIDTQGNIFIPEVGPIHLAGTENKALNIRLQQAISKVFKKDVHVYADLLTQQPIQVYVTGFVGAPGLYDGLSSDSVLYYICRASGINQQEGSFRQIAILRNQRAIHQIDLYDFLLHGKIEHFQLQQGDTIVVRPLHYAVSVKGSVRKAYQYELLHAKEPMASLLPLVSMSENVTYVRLQHSQGLSPVVDYLPIADGLKQTIEAGDELSFVADQAIHQVAVTVNGEVDGKHQFIVKSGTTLAEFIKQIHVSAEGNLEALQLYRKSVAKEQKAAIDSSLARLERQTLTTGAVTEGGAKLQAAQTGMIMKFIDDAKKARLKGQVVLAEPELWHEVILQHNDVLYIPRHSSVVTVGGDVVNAMSVEVSHGLSIRDYILAAGGYSETANKSSVLLVRQNGKVDVVTSLQRHNLVVGGDKIIVLPKAKTEGWQISESLSKIMYQIAVAARVALVV